ncbi:hypothetical protein [Acidovorax sp. HDW3]|uniref:hypothetical protein n=1 Tax=Acidovorax sp. HDW3 TaxID=2714923 RepID=UPI001F0D425E|nr:hypothetical protein [Acidovorax sp. HDW3]
MKVIVIAGPNGAGKTTFAREFLPHEAACPVFVNADLIAAGLSPFDVEAAALQAGRLMLQELERAMNTQKPIHQARTADLRGSWQALLRAAQRARELAAQTGTELIVSRDGVIERIRPLPDAAGSQVREPVSPYGDKA